MKFSKSGDTFIPLGTDDVEILGDVELTYSVEDRIRTRRWIWRQSEQGKIIEKSENIFFPIDGFIENYDNIIAARDELAELIKSIFSDEVQVGFVDKNSTEFEIN